MRDDFIEDLFAFLCVTEGEGREVQPGETVVCSNCGRELAEGELYQDSDGEIRCAECLL